MAAVHRSHQQAETSPDDRSGSLLTGYLSPGYSFSRSQGIRHETVILIHGWGVRAASMNKLAVMLRQAGYSVLNYDYPSSKKDIVRHAEAFLACYRREHPEGKIHFLTHSMGGLILRHALSRMTESECRAIDSIVLLGPPNHGSVLAWFGKLLPIRGFHDTLRDMIPGSEALRIPPPKWLPPVGIIAGKFDLKVSGKSTRLPGGLPCSYATVFCSHPGLRKPRHTGPLVLHFFQHKNFSLQGESYADPAP